VEVDRHQKRPVRALLEVMAAETPRLLFWVQAGAVVLAAPVAVLAVLREAAADRERQVLSELVLALPTQEAAVEAVRQAGVDQADQASAVMAGAQTPQVAQVQSIRAAAAVAADRASGLATRREARAAPVL
jgi:hypothetical protein